MPETPREPASRQLKAVLWDMDGTLVDTEPYWIASETELIQSFGGQWSHEQALTLVGQSLWHSAGILQEAGIPWDRRQIIDELTRRVIARLNQKFPWRPGARELLRELKIQGVRCALVTMSEGPMAKEILGQLPSETFELMVTGDQVSQGKPHPEAYLTAVAELSKRGENLRIDECVALEDSIPGTTSALSAGIVTVGIPHAVPLPEAPGQVLWDTLEGKTSEDLRDVLNSTMANATQEVTAAEKVSR